MTATASPAGFDRRFNEAAGFTRRKQTYARPDPVAQYVASMRPPDLPGGNLLDAGIQRKHVLLASMRPPDLPGGNNLGFDFLSKIVTAASMRPPDLPGGNSLKGRAVQHRGPRFNEAAGFTRRKRPCDLVGMRGTRSMLQ